MRLAEGDKENPKGIISEIDNIGCAIGNLGKTITELQERLTAVMLPEIPSTSGEGEPPTGELCPMAGAIRNLADSVDCLVIRVRGCLDRLDI
jgi:hypothetical protein